MDTQSKSVTAGAYKESNMWVDLNDAEKIERMHEVVVSLQNQLGRAQSEMHKLKSSFKNHSHLDGKILEPYNEYYGNDLNGIAKSVNVGYF